MFPSIVTEIAALPGWNAPMLLLFVKATLILVAALGMTVAMQRRSAGARHLVWLATLGIVLLVPAVTAWVPPLKLAILPAAPAARVHTPVVAPLEGVKSVDIDSKAAPVTPATNAFPVSEKAGFIK